MGPNRLLLVAVCSVSLWVAVCSVSLWLPSAAWADHGELVMDDVLGRYMQVAADYWGAEPACPGGRGQPTGVHAVLFDDPNPSVAAMAELPGCRIWLDRDMWPGPLDEERCNVLVHEWGHLLGHEHSGDPSDLMWHEWMNLVVPACAALRPAAPAGPPLTEAHPPRTGRKPTKKPQVRRRKTTRNKPSTRRRKTTRNEATTRRRKTKRRTRRKTTTRCTRRARKGRAKRCTRRAPRPTVLP